MATDNNIVNKIVNVLDSKKAKDIRVLNIQELTTLTDYFIIATGNSNTQVQALCDNVEDELSKEGINCIGKEGYNDGTWILLSYEDVFVHIFQDETREFYGLEHIWKDAKIEDISDIVD